LATGGLVGLFLGMSFVSIFEVFYFVFDFVLAVVGSTVFPKKK
jgi:hypothetical protein